ncbi:MAG TPA: hemolysin family protein [Gemmatimonadaceae bacterium]
MTITAVIIILVLIALNGLFVAAEFTIVGAPKTAIDRLARQGNRAARAVARVLASPVRQDRFIATAQLGITAASLGLGMYGEHLLAEWLAEHFARLGIGGPAAAHTVASIVAVALLTYLHIVFGEMVPKTLALQQAQRMALWIVPVMRIVQFTVYPLVVVLNGIGNGLLRVIGIRRERMSQEHYRTADELAYLVRETEAGGLLRKESAGVVQELFRFGVLTAEEVMVPRVRVIGVPLGAGRDEIRSVLHGGSHTRYPVFRETVDEIVGVVHVKDLLHCLSTGQRVMEGQIRAAPILPVTARTHQVLAAMGEQRSQLAVVIDEHGGTAGIVTIEDLFEEVVGEFGEGPGTEIAGAGQGSVRVAGTVRLSEAGAALDRVLSHEEVDTVSGLVLALLGSAPRVGDVVLYDGVRIEVQAVRRRGVVEALMTRVSAARDDGNDTD